MTCMTFWLSFDCSLTSGKCIDQGPTHCGRLREGLRHDEFHPLANRRRVVPRINRLYQLEVVLQPRHWFSVRWHIPWFHARRDMQRPHRPVSKLQRWLQGLPAPLLGGASHHVREGTGVGAVDVEGRECRRMVVSGWPRGWMDPKESYGTQIPQNLQLSCGWG